MRHSYQTSMMVYIPCARARDAQEGEMDMRALLASMLVDAFLQLFAYSRICKHKDGTFELIDQQETTQAVEWFRSDDYESACKYFGLSPRVGRMVARNIMLERERIKAAILAGETPADGRLKWNVRAKSNEGRVVFAGLKKRIWGAFMAELDLRRQEFEQHRRLPEEDRLSVLIPRGTGAMGVPTDAWNGSDRDFGPGAILEVEAGNG